MEKDTVTLNEEQGEVLPWRRTRRRTTRVGGVRRAERRCQGHDGVDGHDVDCGADRRCQGRDVSW